MTEVRLFRPTRPDFIETGSKVLEEDFPTHCSGLLGRTSLRLHQWVLIVSRYLFIVPAY